MVRALLAARMVPLEKEAPGLAVNGDWGGIWWRCLSKCALTVGSADAKAACGSNQLCMGLESGIEAGIGSVLKRIEMDDGMIFLEEEVDDNIWAQR